MIDSRLRVMKLGNYLAVLFGITWIGYVLFRGE